MHGLCYVVYMYIYTLNSKLKSLGPVDGFTFCKPFCMQYFLRSFVKPYHYYNSIIIIIDMTLASFNVLITIGRILGSFTLGIIYSSFKWGRSTRKAIAHEAATNISSSKPFALVSSNALRTEGNTTALLIRLGKSDRPLAAILVPAFSTSGGGVF